jgi:hypothetical protein
LVGIGGDFSSPLSFDDDDDGEEEDDDMLVGELVCVVTLVEIESRSDTTIPMITQLLRL